MKTKHFTNVHEHESISSLFSGEYYSLHDKAESLSTLIEPQKEDLDIFLMGLSPDNFLIGKSIRPIPLRSKTHGNSFERLSLTLQSKIQFHLLECQKQGST